MGHKKVIRTFVVTALVILAYTLQTRGDQQVRSKVSAVTVYPDRALITRTATFNLTPGTSTVAFGNLPVGLVDQSIRVSGDAESAVKILDVQVKTAYTDTIPDSRIKNLQDKLSSLKSQEQILTKRIEVLKTEMSFIDSLRVYYARTAGSATSKTPYQDWETALRFVEKNMDTVNAKSLEANFRLKEVREKIALVEDEIRRTQSYPRKIEKVVTVTLSSENAGQSELHLSYMLFGAGWSPLYEERVTSRAKTMEFIYSGVVRQSTGEDWKNVALTLSTAQPSAGGAPPELAPWRIGVLETYPALGAARAKAMSEVTRPGNVSVRSMSVEPGRGGNTVTGTVIDQDTGDPLPGASVMVEGTNQGASTGMNGSFTITGIPAGVYRITTRYVGYAPITSQNVVVNSSIVVYADFRLAAARVTGMAVTVQAQRANVSEAISLPEAEVHEGVTAATFAIAAPADIPGDNNPHKVTIASATLPASLSYACVPKLSEDVYLTDSTRNTTDYPILPGPANVFLDNSFVAASSIGNVPPGQDFSSYLGADKGIRVERKLINQFTESTGLLSRKTKTTYTYLITVDNGKSVPVDLLVKDQVPVSTDERIAVQLLAPDPAEAKPDELGIIEWHLTLKPQEKRDLNLKFSIEYPSDLRMSGI